MAPVPSRRTPRPSLSSAGRAGILVTALLGTVLVLPGVAEGQEASPMAEYRSTLMQGIRYHFGALRSLTGNVDLPSHVVHHARSVEALSAMAQDVFPEGSGGEGTRALPAIWSENEDFQAKLAAFQDAAEALRRAAEAGDADGVTSGIQAVGGSCRDCHTDYRADANP